jgi:hypothetical protein
MKPLPQTKNAPAVRTDLSDEQAWKHVCAAMQKPTDDDGFVANLDLVDDPEYDGLTADQLQSALSGEARWPFALLIDRTALLHPEHPILVVDLHDEPGRTFRVLPAEVWAVENNLSIANMEFAEFADAVGDEGIFRGWA